MKGLEFYTCIWLSLISVLFGFIGPRLNRCRSNVMYVCNLYASEERIYILKWTFEDDWFQPSSISFAGRDECGTLLPPTFSLQMIQNPQRWIQRNSRRLMAPYSRTETIWYMRYMNSISIWLCRNLCERNEGSELNQIVFNTTTIRNPEQCKFLQELGFQQWFVLSGVKNLRKDLSSVKLFFLPENCVFLISIWL